MVVFTILIYVTVFVKSAKIRFISSEIIHSNAALSSVGCKTPYKKEQSFQKKLITIFFSFLALNIFVSLAVTHPLIDLPYITVATVFSALTQSMYAQFCAVSNVVNQRFMAINEELDKLRTLIHKIDWMNAADRRLKTLCKLHLRLQRVLNEMESYFGVLFSASIFLSLIHI